MQRMEDLAISVQGVGKLSDSQGTHCKLLELVCRGPLILRGSGMRPAGSEWTTWFEGCKVSMRALQMPDAHPSLAKCIFPPSLP